MFSKKVKPKVNADAEKTDMLLPETIYVTETHDWNYTFNSYVLRLFENIAGAAKVTTSPNKKIGVYKLDRIACVQIHYPEPVVTQTPCGSCNEKESEK